MDVLSRSLVLHGSLVLMAAFIGGFYFRRAIKRGEGEVAWRVVHSGSSIAGVLLIALAAVVPHLLVPIWLSRALTWSMIGGIEVFVVAMVLAAASGKRGLSRGGSWQNRAVNVSYVAATALSMIGSGLLVYSALVSLLA